MSLVNGNTTVVYTHQRERHRDARPYAFLPKKTTGSDKKVQAFQYWKLYRQDSSACSICGSHNADDGWSVCSACRLHEIQALVRGLSVSDVPKKPVREFKISGTVTEIHPSVFEQPLWRKAAAFMAAAAGLLASVVTRF